MPIRTMKAGIAIAVCSAVSACAAPDPAPGKQIALRGEVRLSGNMPRPTVVLRVAEDNRWELLGVSLDRASALQNKVVDVNGTVERAAAAGPLLRAVRVQSIQPVAP